MLGPGLVLMLACAIAYYKIGQYEYGRGFLIAAISVLLWVVVQAVLGGGWGAALVVQALLLVALTRWNAFVRGPNRAV